MNTGLLIFIIIIAVLVLGGLLSLVPYLRLQRAARAAGVGLKLSKIMGMKVRKTNPANIVTLLIKAKNADVELTSDMLETLVLSKGRAARVVDALIAAKSAGLPLKFAHAAAIDLSGGDPLEFAGLIKQPCTEQDIRNAVREYISGLRSET